MSENKQNKYSPINYKLTSNDSTKPLVRKKNRFKAFFIKSALTLLFAAIFFLAGLVYSKLPEISEVLQNFESEEKVSNEEIYKQLSKLEGQIDSLLDLANTSTSIKDTTNNVEKLLKTQDGI